MKTINKEDMQEEHKYCPHCGGMVNFKQCLTLLVSPPIREYHCSLCHKVALKLRGD